MTEFEKEMLDIKRKEQKEAEEKKMIGMVICGPALLFGLWIFFSILGAG